MNIRTLQLEENHWTTTWIPISYKNILNKNQYNKSYTFLWSKYNEVYAICRAYYINNRRIEIGDLWIDEKFRGKKYNEKNNYSTHFLSKVISKIWKLYPYAKLQTLVVPKNNIKALNLYKKLNFVDAKDINKFMNDIKNGIYLVRYKKRNHIL